MARDKFDCNRLATASSPYLRQHAGNPVHWQAWNGATLAHAREQDVPILLSIGYSACHWCHVMAHECFENPDVAARMNASFVNIKLDREERPDIDQVFQLAHQALRGRGGGWPLTAFLDPQDLSPFFIGTYFPPTPRHGMPAFAEVLAQVRAWFDTHRNELQAQATQLQHWLQQMAASTPGTLPESRLVQERACQRIAQAFDKRQGGSQGAPKFPRASEIEWLLDVSGRQPGARAMAHRTLRAMASRGLQDHLGGGFFRYCVDDAWTIPHFEKMLYDNALLLGVYARAKADTAAGSLLHDIAATAVQGILDWLEREMSAGNGLFFSSLDADSEHEEGKFYLWTREAMQAALSPVAYQVAETVYGLDHAPNFENRAWHLLRDLPLEDLADRLGKPVDTLRADCARARGTLFAARAKRVPPARDDKLLTAWNALTLSSLARTARLLEDDRAQAMARRALSALRETAWNDQALSANIETPGARIPGFLDDHAFVLDALLECLQLEFEPDILDWTTTLADALLETFTDQDSGAFWFSRREHATPLVRGRSWTDDALPNGNAVAILSLLRLGHLVGNTRYLDAAEHALLAATGPLEEYPQACPTLLRALDEYQHPRLQIVVRCGPGQLASWQAEVRRVLRNTNEDNPPRRADAFLIAAQNPALPGVLATRTARGKAGTAYLCRGRTCQAPVSSPDRLAEAFNAATR